MASSREGWCRFSLCGGNWLFRTLKKIVVTERLCPRFTSHSLERMNAKITTLSFVALAAAGVAFTQNGRGLEARFDQFDTNKDGVLSGTELDASPILRRLDLNGDGRITKQEALEALGKLQGLVKPADSSGSDPNNTGAVFRAMDKNADGKLSREELTNAEIFARLDIDKDGSVTREEAIKMIGEVIPEKWRKRREEVATGAATPAPALSPQEMPRRLKGSEHGVGRQVADLKLTDAKGGEVSLTASLKDHKALVIGMVNTTCPISAKLAPEMARIENEYGARGVGFLFVSPKDGDSDAELLKFAADQSLKSPFARDAKGEVVATLGATTTTEVFVLDASRTLIYRGAVNDQYGLGYAKEAPTESFLRSALDALLGGGKPSTVATTAPGCALDVPAKSEPQTAATSLTWHREISRIMQSHCVECHHADGLAPFSLETYADVIEHAGMIKKQVTRGAMPPWFAARQPTEKESPWANDCSLSDRDKADLLAWLDSSRPEGNLKDAPVARKWANEWTIGKPDYVVQLPRPVSIKAEGTMPYQVVNVETELSEDKWVQGYEILPTDRKVVHHVIVSVHPKGARIRDREEGAGGYWAAYVPGNSKQIYPDGFARRLPAGSIVSFQIHYTPTGKATTDQLRMGLIFAKQTPRYAVETTSVPRRAINIPPGAANHVETEVRTIPFDMNAMAFLAHMHVRGRSFKYELIKPDGTAETLLDIPRYDFNWQLRYDLGQYRVLPKGSQLKITAVYDNSAANPANPDPAKFVKWGPQTQDEMMIGYIEHFVPVGSGKVASN